MLGTSEAQFSQWRLRALTCCARDHLAFDRSRRTCLRPCAASNGVFPRLSRMLGRAPACRSKRTTLTWPRPHANHKGVRPDLSGESTTAPASTKAVAASKEAFGLRLSVARRSGVAPASVCASVFALDSRRTLMTSECGTRADKHKGVPSTPVLSRQAPAVKRHCTLLAEVSYGI